MINPNELWPPIVTAALIGSERQLPTLPAPGSPLGDLLAQFDQSDREGLLLGAAATLSLYQRIGHLPTTDKQPLVEPCEEDNLAPISSRAGQHLETMLKGTYREALREWLEGLANRSGRVPDESLPALLEMGRAQTDFQPLVLSVLGKRGRWLAAQNPAWSFATGEGVDAETTWQTGSRAIRAFLLRKIRAVDPAKAREMLAATWSSESSEERATFLQTFAVGLSMADETFLEVALDDKRKEVRAAAADLLSCLPDSRLMGRMIERVKPLLQWSFESKKKKSKIEVTLLDACDKAMIRDGIEPKPPFGGKGEKTWWLQQMLEVVPPAFWLETWNTTPAKLLEVVANNPEWGKLLQEGLIKATIRHNVPTMAEALLTSLLPKSLDLVDTRLLRLFPNSRQEDFMLNLLQSKENASNLATIIMGFMNVTTTWSEQLGRTFLEIMQQHIATATNGYDYQWRNILSAATLLMPLSLADEAANGWPREAKFWNFWSDSVNEFVALLQFRRDMINALREN